MVPLDLAQMPQLDSRSVSAGTGHEPTGKTAAHGYPLHFSPPIRAAADVPQLWTLGVHRCVCRHERSLASAAEPSSAVDDAGRLLRRLSVDNVKLVARAEDDRAIGRLVRAQFSDLRRGVALSCASGNLKVCHVDVYTVIAAQRS